MLSFTYATDSFQIAWNYIFFIRYFCVQLITLDFLAFCLGSWRYVGHTIRIRLGTGKLCIVNELTQFDNDSILELNNQNKTDIHTNNKRLTNWSNDETHLWCPYHQKLNEFIELWGLFLFIAEWSSRSTPNTAIN